MDINHRLRMKSENQRNILNLINTAPVSRTVLSEKLGLTQAAVSQLTEELIEDGIIRSCGCGEQSTGRRPELLEICPEWGYVISVSFHRSGAEVGLVDLKGNILDCYTGLPLTDDYNDTINIVLEYTHQLLERNPDCVPRIIGIGTSVPGPMDACKGQLLAPPGLPASWHGLPLQEILADKLDFPVYIEHNSRAIAKAEMCFGSGMSYSNFIVLNINYGISSGLVIDGKVFSGSNGIGCEIGHVTFRPNGRLCSCGGKGCLEQYASTKSILYEAGRNVSGLNSWKDLVDRSGAGDPSCKRYLELEASYLSEVIVNLMNFCDLEAILLTGQISYGGNDLVELIRKETASSLKLRSGILPEISLSTIKGNPYLVSGAAVVIYKLYHEPLFFHMANIARKQR